MDRDDGQTPPKLEEGRLRNSRRDETATEDFAGYWRCKGCWLVDKVPTSIWLKPCCGGCCLYGIWTCCYVPMPAISCVTACLCKSGNIYQTEKGGVKTGELLVVGTERQPMLALSPAVDMSGTMCEDSSIYCVK